MAGKRKENRVPVTTRALIQRINRRTRGDDSGAWWSECVLKAARGAKAQQDLGSYFLLGERSNFVIEKDVDLDAFGRELGVLKEYEKVVDE